MTRDQRFMELLASVDTLGEEELGEALALAKRLGVDARESAFVALARAAARVPRLASAIMGLAYRAHQQPSLAIEIYELLLAQEPPPAELEEGEPRGNWLRAANNALVALQVAKRFAEAARLADRVVGFAAENPHLCHSAACTYVAVGRLDEALALCRRAVELEYEHLDQLRDDEDLGGLRERADFQALFVAVPALPEVPEWAAESFSPEQYAHFLETVRRELTQRKLLADYSHLHCGLVHVGDARFGLGGLRRKCADLPMDAWAQAVTAHFGALVDAAPSDPEQLKACVKVRIYAEEFLDHACPVHRAYAPGLILALVLDLPERVETLTAGTAAKLALPEDELFALGFAHLAEEQKLTAVELEGLHPDITVLAGESFFSASHLLRLADYFAIPERGALVAVPSRHKLIFAPIQNGVHDVMTQMIQLSHEIYASDGGALCPHPYLHDGKSLHRISSGVRDDGQVWCAPPEELLNRIVRLA